MRHVRASSGRRAAVVVAADVTAVADTVVGGVTVVVAASEEAATSQPALPAGRCCEVRCLSGFALGADLISALRTAHATAQLGKYGQGWIRTSEGVKPADLQSAPFGHFGTYPFGARDFKYPRAS
jgi:hypothetical protein